MTLKSYGTQAPVRVLSATKPSAFRPKGGIRTSTTLAWPLLQITQLAPASQDVARLWSAASYASAIFQPGFRRRAATPLYPGPSHSSRTALAEKASSGAKPKDPPSERGKVADIAKGRTRIVHPESCVQPTSIPFSQITRISPSVEIPRLVVPFTPYSILRCALKKTH